MGAVLCGRIKPLEMVIDTCVKYFFLFVDIVTTLAPGNTSTIKGEIVAILN